MPSYIPPHDRGHSFPQEQDTGKEGSDLLLVRGKQCHKTCRQSGVPGGNGASGSLLFLFVRHPRQLSSVVAHNLIVVGLAPIGPKWISLWEAEEERDRPPLPVLGLSANP